MSPSTFKTPQGIVNRIHRFGRSRPLTQLLYIQIIERRNQAADLQPLFRHPYPDGTPVMRRAFLAQVAIFDQFLHVLRNIQALVITTIDQFTDCQLFIADMGQNKALEVVDVLNTEAIQLRLDHFDKLTMQPLDQ